MDNNAAFKYFSYGKKIYFKGNEKKDDGYCITKLDDNNSKKLYEKILNKFSFSQANVPIKRILGKELGYSYLGKTEDSSNNKYCIFIKYSIAPIRDLAERVFIQRDYILIEYNDFKKMDFDSFQIINHYFKFFDNPEVPIKIKKSRSEQDLLNQIASYLTIDFIKILYTAIYSSKQVTIVCDKNEESEVCDKNEESEVEKLLTAIIMLLFPTNLRPLITFSTYPTIEIKGNIKIKVFFKEVYLDNHIVIDFNKKVKIGTNIESDDFPILYKSDSFDIIDIVDSNKSINKYLPEFKPEIDLNSKNKELIETVNLAWELVNIEKENDTKKQLEKYYELIQEKVINKKSIALNKNIAFKKIINHIKSGLTSEFEQKLSLKILHLLSSLIKKNCFINLIKEIFYNVYDQYLLYSIELYDFLFKKLLKDDNDIKNNASLRKIFLKLTERKIPISQLDKYNSWLSHYSEENESIFRFNILKNISFNKDELNEQDFPKIFNLIKSLKDIEFIKNNILTNEKLFDEYRLGKINHYIFFVNLFSYVVENNELIIIKIYNIKEFNFYIYCCERINKYLEQNDQKIRLFNWICLFIEENIQIYNKSSEKVKIEEIIEELANYLIEFREFNLTTINNLLKNKDLLISNSVKSNLLYLVAKKQLFESLNEFENMWEEIIRIEKLTDDNMTSLPEKIFNFIESTHSKPAIINSFLPYIHEQFINNIDKKNLQNVLKDYIAKLNTLLSKITRLPMLFHLNIEHESKEKDIFLYLLNHILSDFGFKEQIAILPLLFFEISGKKFIVNHEYQKYVKDTINRKWEPKKHFEREIICKIGNSLFENYSIKTFFNELSRNKSKVSSEEKINDKIKMLKEFNKFIDNLGDIVTTLNNNDNKKSLNELKKTLIEILNKLIKQLWPEQQGFFKKNYPVKDKIESTIEKLK